MKITIVIFSLLITHVTYAQVISKKDIVNTEWFSENIDSLFFKSDTVKFIKYSYIVSDYLGFNIYAESERRYYGHGYYVKFKFSRFGKLHLWDIAYHCSTRSQIGLRKWKFNNTDNTLSVYKNKDLEFSFMPISIKEIEVPTGDARTPEVLKTLELTMIKIK